MNVSFELSSILLGIKVIDLRVILAVNRDLWQLKINQKAYDCHKMDESPWQKDYITLSLWVCWSLSRQFKRTSTFLAFSFPFPFSFSPFFYRDISSALFNILFTDVSIFHLIFNDVNARFRDQNVFKLVIGNVTFSESPFSNTHIQDLTSVHIILLKWGDMNYVSWIR